MKTKWGGGVFLALIAFGFLIININMCLIIDRIGSIEVCEKADSDLVAENLALQLENGVLKLQIESDNRVLEENKRLKAQNDIYMNLLKSLPTNLIEDLKKGEDIAVVRLETEEPVAAYVSATAYTAAEDECSRPVTDPDYGRTASGDFVEEWLTVASNDLPLGTRVYIPYFKDEENGGLFIVKDRMPKGYKDAIDVYMTTKDAAFEFGRQDMTVYILPDE